jgi:2-polyprenyl-6-methoxyphenol hydroxylase-like FAD-dependent oxidoreductase
MAMQGSRRYSIAVSGAGTAGLAASAFLAEQGHDVCLFERFAEPRPVGAGLLLQPTGLACLACLGVDTIAIRLGARIDRLTGETVSGRRVLDMAYADLSSSLFGVGIHRASLFAALKGAADARNVRIVPATEIVSCETGSSPGRILIDRQGRHHGPFDLVVDATGTRSPLRRFLPASRRERPFAYSALWGVVPLPPQWSGRNVLSQRYQGARVMIGVLPIGRLPDGDADLAALFWSLPANGYEAWRAEGLEAWKMRLMRLWPDVAPLLEHIPTVSHLAHATYVDVTVSSPVGDRLVVIGDAAHATSPQLGQGANLALADALILSRSLATSDDLATALATYARARRRHVSFYQFASRWLTPFFQSDSRLAGLLRDRTFGPSAYVGFVRRQMVETLCGVKTGPLSRFDPGTWHGDYTVGTRATLRTGTATTGAADMP